MILLFFWNTGGGRAIKSYIHIRDVSHGELLAMLKGHPGQIYHISPDQGITIRSLVQMICAKMGKKFGESTLDVSERLGQDAAYVIDSSLIRNELGWQPIKSNEKGLTEVIEWIEINWECIKQEPLEYIHKP